MVKFPHMLRLSSVRFLQKKKQHQKAATSTPPSPSSNSTILSDELVKAAAAPVGSVKVVDDGEAGVKLDNFKQRKDDLGGGGENRRDVEVIQREERNDPHDDDDNTTALKGAINAMKCNAVGRRRHRESVKKGERFWYANAIGRGFEGLRGNVRVARSFRAAEDHCNVRRAREVFRKLSLYGDIRGKERALRDIGRSHFGREGKLRGFNGIRDRVVRRKKVEGALVRFREFREWNMLKFAFGKFINSLRDDIKYKKSFEAAKIWSDKREMKRFLRSLSLNARRSSSCRRSLIAANSFRLSQSMKRLVAGCRLSKRARDDAAIKWCECRRLNAVMRECVVYMHVRARVRSITRDCRERAMARRGLQGLRGHAKERREGRRMGRIASKFSDGCSLLRAFCNWRVYASVRRGERIKIEKADSFFLQRQFLKLVKAIGAARAYRKTPEYVHLVSRCFDCVACYAKMERNAREREEEAEGRAEEFWRVRRVKVAIGKFKGNRDRRSSCRVRDSVASRHFAAHRMLAFLSRLSVNLEEGKVRRFKRRVKSRVLMAKAMEGLCANVENRREERARVEAVERAVGRLKRDRDAKGWWETWRERVRRRERGREIVRDVQRGKRMRDGFRDWIQWTKRVKDDERKVMRLACFFCLVFFFFFF